MILTIYIIILIYFLLGAIGFHIINRRRERKEAVSNRVKYITYFFIINIIFFSIVYYPLMFSYIGMMIIIAGMIETFSLFRRSGYSRKGFFSLFIIIFLTLCGGFYFFTTLEKGLVLFTFLVVSIFDAFSQISGQLLGRKKLFPSVSPGKTFEGLAGGIIVALGSSLLLRRLIDVSPVKTLLLASGIVIFAFIGDMGTSLYKRRHNVKDFSNLLPGHGGFMDRFDSIIAGGAFVAFLHFFLL